MINPTGSFLIPDFISAGSAKSLRDSMIKNNLKFKQNFKYDIVFNTKDKKFYAFFYHGADSFELLSEEGKKDK
jgi:hypothetical protein